MGLFFASLVLSQPLFQMDAHFRVTHVVSFELGLISALVVERDGTLLGSEGWVNHHSGSAQRPLIIRKSKLIPFNADRTVFDSSDSTALGYLGDSKIFVQVLDSKNSGIFSAELRNGKVTNIHSSKYSPKRTSWASVKYSQRFEPNSDPDFNRHDNIMPGTISWYQLPNKFKLGSELATYDAEEYEEYGVTIKLPSGRRVPFLNQFKQLKGLSGRRVVYVSPKGWFVVLAENGSKSQLVWIEPR